MCESVGKADLLSDHLNSKKSREAVDLPPTCSPSLSLTTFAFRSNKVRLLLLDVDPNGGNDPLGMFPLLLRKSCRLARGKSGIFWKFQLLWILVEDIVRSI